MKFPFLLAMAIAPASCSAAPPAGGPPARPALEAAPAQPPPLAARLRLRDGQAGFAGESGVEVVVETDGRYQVARFLNETVSAPHATGVLQPAALAALARALAAASEPPLPARLGQAPPVNPRRLLLRCGKVDSTFLLGPGQEPSPALAGAEAAAAGRFLAVWAVVRQSVPLPEPGHK